MEKAAAVSEEKVIVQIKSVPQGLNRLRKKFMFTG